MDMMGPFLSLLFPAKRRRNRTADTRYSQVQQIPESYEDVKHSSRVSAKAIPASYGDVEYQTGQERQIRRERRTRVARGLLSLLTSLISLAVVYCQGSTWLIYRRTMGIEGAWPDEPNLLPTLVLLATAVVAVFIDIFALGLYMSSSTALGRKGYRVC